MKRMNKLLCLLLSSLLLVGVLTACSDEEVAVAGQVVTAIADMAGDEDTSEASSTSETAAPAEESASASEAEAPAGETASADTSETAVAASSAAEEETASADTSEQAEYVDYYFRNEKLLNQHYEKHGIDMGFASAEEYEAAASDVINNPDALNKTEAEDGDQVYYVEATNEFVILSTDGYIRTYFNPSGGLDYYNRQ